MKEKELRKNRKCRKCGHSPIEMFYLVYQRNGGKEADFVREKCPKCGATAKHNEETISKQKRESNGI